MDPVEKSRLIACRLPARPNLSRGRNGRARSYWTLSYRHPGKYGRSDCKERLYLGCLAPLQVLAIRQVIADAWLPRPSRAELIARLGVRYRQIRKVAAVIACRAGYSLHGYQLRRTRVMKSPIRETIRLLDDPDGICRWAMGSANAAGVNPKVALLNVLNLLRVFVVTRMAANMETLMKAGQRRRPSLKTAQRAFKQNEKLAERLHVFDGIMQKVRDEIAKETSHAS